MLDKPVILYTVTELLNNKPISELTTISPWFAISDFLLKSREASKNEQVFDFIPLQKTRNLDPKVIFVYQFFKGKKINQIREITITSKVVNKATNSFNKAITLDQYQSKDYLEMVSKIAKHVRAFRQGDLSGTIPLLRFATLDIKHPVWVGIISNSEHRPLARGNYGML